MPNNKLHMHLINSY